MANDIAQRITALTELAKAIPESLLTAVDDPNSPGKKTKKLGFGTFLKTYNRSAAEISEGLSNDDLDFKEDEGHIIRYRENPIPGTTNMTAAITTALSVMSQLGGGLAQIPDEDVAYDGTIDFPRHTGLKGNSFGKGSDLIPLSATALLQLDSQCELRDLNLLGPSTLVGSVGVKFGRSTNFEAFSKLNRVTIENFEQNVLIDNAFWIELYDVDMDGGTYGLTFNPTAGAQLGFFTTIHLRRCVIQNHTRNGIRNIAGSAGLQCSIRDCNVENNGDNTFAQIDFSDATSPIQAFIIDGLYLEDVNGATGANGIVAETGHFKNIYLNGATIAFDFGTGAANAILENVTMVAVTTSVQATGGAIAHVKMKEVTFPAGSSVNFNATTVTYDNCSGAGLPTNVSAHSLEISGVVPIFGIGEVADSKIRRIEFFSFTENITAAADTTTAGTLQSPGTSSMGPNVVVVAMPTGALPTGVTFHPVRVSDSAFRLDFANVTGTGQLVTNTFNCILLRFRS